MDNLRLILMALSLLPGIAYAGSEHIFRTAGGCGGRWPIADTGQTVHYSTAIGDDSDYRPAATQPDFTIYNPVGASSVTVDNHTGLMWVLNPNDAGIGGTYTWENAIAACEGLNYAGYTDWRLPNIKELVSIVDYGRLNPSINTAYYFNTNMAYYWSSTIYSLNTEFALEVAFSGGGMNGSGSKTNMAYIRCVR